MDLDSQALKFIKTGRLELVLQFKGPNLLRVDLPPTPPADLDEQDLRQAFSCLSEYAWDMEKGPSFHRQVWRYLRQIPRGEVRTYGAVAAALGRPKAARAVGMACAANPLLLLVPCHRVVASAGLGGFRAGSQWKRALLELEAALVGSH